MPGSRRPRLARFLVALVFAACPAAPSMAQPRDEGAMLNQLYDGAPQAKLSAERPAVSLAFNLPDHAVVARARLILAARPAREIPASALKISLNGGDPVALTPDPYPFTAQFELSPASARGGQNRLTFALTDCAAAGEDAGWVIDLAQSRLDLVYLPAAPQDLEAFNAWFASDFPAPDRIAVTTPGLDAETAAELQALTAIALGRRVSRPLSFVASGADADLRVRVRLDERLSHARLLPSGGSPVMLDVLAPSAAAARNALRAFGEYSSQSDRRLADGGHGDFDYFEFRAGSSGRGAMSLTLSPVDRMHAPLMLNGEPAGRLRAHAGEQRRTMRLTDIRPGRNRLTLGGSESRCGAALSPRTPHFDAFGDGDDDLSRLAAGSLGRDGYSLVLPAEDAPRRAALALLSRLASESRDYSAPAWVGFEALSAPPGRDLAVLSPGGLLPQPLVDRSPRALAASIRRQIPVPKPPSLPVRVGGYALAAGTPGDGVAARFQTPGEESWTTIVTSPVAGDFAHAAAPLITARTLARLDGRVSRWSGGKVWVQDRGAWSPPGAAAMLPDGKELWFTLCCVFLLAGLAVAHFGRPAARRG